jgi:ribonuclease D
MKVDDWEVIAVNTNQHLADLCAEWAELSALALDTEFMRTNTFYPKLGLLQISDGSHCYLIDPLEISDWQPFTELFDSTTLVFILHSAGEDLVLLFTSLGKVPAQIFDTQIAAAFLGHGFSLSYQALVKKELDKDIEKDETRSDWLQRPLTEAQLRYAALDVRYLHEMMDRLQTELERSEKTPWFEGECAQQLAIAIETEAPSAWQENYKTISNAWRLDIRGLTLLQRLSYWRELQARRRDKPRSWIAKDAELFGIADHMASKPTLELQHLMNVSEVSKGLLQNQGARLLKAMEQPTDDLPEQVPEKLSPPMSIELRGIIKACQKVTREMADELSIAPELLARKRQILAVLSDLESRRELNWEGDMAGWRKELLQEKFEQITVRKQ